MTHHVGFSHSSPSVAAVVGSLDESLSCCGAHITPQAHRFEILGVRLSEPCIPAARSAPTLVCTAQISARLPLLFITSMADMISQVWHVPHCLSRTCLHFSCFIAWMFCWGCAGLEGGDNQAAERTLEEQSWSQAKAHHHVQICHHKLQWIVLGIFF